MQLLSFQQEHHVHVTVPAGICFVTISVAGAGGGDTVGTVPNQGGLGAAVEARVAVTPGAALDVLVAGAGQNATGSQGGDGGDGGDSDQGEGGGGGGGTGFGGGGGGIFAQPNAAGGGGGGYGGGAGGGANGDGGGGGSSFVANGATNVSSAADNAAGGIVTVTYDSNTDGCPMPAAQPVTAVARFTG